MRFWLLLSFTFVCGISFSDDPVQNTTPVSLIARLGNNPPEGKSAKIYVYSKTQLKNVELRFESVEQFFKMEANLKAEPYFPYGTTSYFPAVEGKRYLVRAIRSDGTRFTHVLTLQKTEKGDFEVSVAAHSEESKEKVDAELAKARTQQAASQKAVANGGGDQLFQLINNYRVSRGLQPLIWDPSLCVADDGAHSNFKSGRIPGASRSNWAGATGHGAFNMWLASQAGHHENMLSGTYGGIGYSGNTATLNVR